MKIFADIILENIFLREHTTKMLAQKMNNKTSYSFCCVSKKKIPVANCLTKILKKYEVVIN